MKPPNPIRGLLRQSFWLLRIASLLVPRAQRKEWYQEWQAEVWHWTHFLLESGRLNQASRMELARHLWGAFSDAAWLRFDREKVLTLRRQLPRTPRFCLTAIALVLLIVVVGTGFAPTIRWCFSSLPYKSPERLADLSFSGTFIHYHSDTLFLTVKAWEKQSRTAEAISAYSWQPAALSTPGQRLTVVSARVSPDFFDVLGINPGMGRLFHSGDESKCFDCIVISSRLWQYGFHRDPAIVGKRVVLQGTWNTVVGVLPNRFWFISPEISVWSVNQNHARSFNFANHTGTVLRLRPGATTEQARDEFQAFVANAGSSFGYASAEVMPLRNRVRQGIQIYLLFTMLALAGSLALLAFRSAGSSSPHVHLRPYDNLRWWLFFAAKTLLLLVTCFVFSLEGTRQIFLMLTGDISPVAGAISSWLFLVTTVLAVMWSLYDQGRRCRICLKRLGHESYVGVPAYLLLDWWGTELVCSQGHGLLHVPEMHASWLQMEQWIQLDESWKPLFEAEEVKAS
jgi:hypothetical protein